MVQDDRAIKVKDSQPMKTIVDYVIPLSIKSGILYQIRVMNGPIISLMTTDDDLVFLEQH